MYSHEAYVAANRFGYGADNQTMLNIGNMPREWLVSQLSPYALPSHEWTSLTALQQFDVYQQEKKQAKKQEELRLKQNPDEKMVADKPIKPFKKLSAKAEGLTLDTILHSIKTTQPFKARLLDFFSNHFSVSTTNQKMRLLAPTLEREAILPNINGSFSDMLIAVESHPAMLIYLNNNNSVGPNSNIAKKRKNKGLNENLAREILELHTLGVGAGYTQHDVTQLAKALTGWSVGGANQNQKSGFRFRRPAHEPGDRLILDNNYVNDVKTNGQARSILQMLAEHPNTAIHLCTKLATHFISDTPPDSVISAMVTIWRSTKGHLPAVLKQMIMHDDSWTIEAQKFKTPRDLVISACRACAITKTRPSLMKMLAILGQEPFLSGSPAGYSDKSIAWTGANPLMTRIEWANHFAGQVKGAPIEIAKLALGPILTQHTQQHIVRAESKRQALTLLLMSPEFQRR
jgi:uncharacterized protein (DUF1800 family)